MLYQLFPQPTQSGLNSSYNSSENHIAMIPTSGESFENNTGAHGSGFSPTAMNEDSDSNGNSAPTVQLVASHHMNEDNGSNENFAPTVQPIVYHHPMITRNLSLDQIVNPIIPEDQTIDEMVAEPSNEDERSIPKYNPYSEYGLNDFDEDYIGHSGSRKDVNDEPTHHHGIVP
ncbi:hypothetical protein LWI28_024718 [Acer negundo]|uniref:Uncharacterized protein n=1 Tax=Acer negundo TaxID=4023 RepID=A0AAD5P674_ACENE|nr:hypothetical protein LWI28_024718 [Acer negundo]